MGKPVIPHLIHALKDERYDVREEAAKSLAMLREVSVTPLVEALKRRNPVARYWAATTLGKIGRTAIEAVDSLTRLLGDRDPSVDSLLAKDATMYTDGSAASGVTYEYCVQSKLDRQRGGNRSVGRAIIQDHRTGHPVVENDINEDKMFALPKGEFREAATTQEARFFRLQQYLSRWVIDSQVVLT